MVQLIRRPLHGTTDIFGNLPLYFQTWFVVNNIDVRFGFMYFFATSGCRKIEKADSALHVRVCLKERMTALANVNTSTIRSEKCGTGVFHS